MASKAFPVKNDAGGYTFRCVLFARSDNQVKSNPTLASGDVTISKDGGAFANLGTLPDVDPDSTKQVKVVLSQSEINADEVVIIFSDASGAEWHDAVFVLHTVAAGYDSLSTLTAAQVNAEADTAIADAALATAANLATLTGYVDTEVAAIKAKTDNLPTDPADQSAVEAAITAATSPLATAAALATVDGIVDDILVDTGTTLPGTLTTISGYVDGVESAIAALNDLSAQEVWEYVTRTLTSAGSGGATAQEVWEYATRTLTANTNLNDPTAAAIADAVLDELLAGHATAGSLSKAITDILEDTSTTLPAQITALNNLSAAQVNAEVDTAIADAALATAANLATLTGYVDTEVAAIKAKTDNLPTDPADQSAVEAAITSATGSLATAASIAALNNLSAAQVVAALQAMTVDGAITWLQQLRVELAALGGKTTGSGTSSVGFRDQADAKDRITATIDVNGNRTAVTLDGS